MNESDPYSNIPSAPVNIGSGGGDDGSYATIKVTDEKSKPTTADAGNVNVSFTE